MIRLVAAESSGRAAGAGRDRAGRAGRRTPPGRRSRRRPRGRRRRRPRDAPPLAGGDEDRERDEEEPDAVAAVLGLEVAREAPTRRTAPPARWLTPIHVPRTARSGSGRPPERALPDRAAGLRAGVRAPVRALAGRVARVEDAPDPAREAREGVVEGRVAMAERYPSCPIRPRRHTGDREGGPGGDRLPRFAARPSVLPRRVAVGSQPPHRRRPARSREPPPTARPKAAHVTARVPLPPAPLRRLRSRPRRRSRPPRRGRRPARRAAPPPGSRPSPSPPASSRSGR